jgi:hypothetical protein
MSGETTASPIASVTVAGQKIQVTVPLPRPGTVSRNIYRTSAGGNDFKLVVSFGGSYDYFQSVWTDNTADSSRGTQSPPNSDGTQQWGLGAAPDGMLYYTRDPAGAASAPASDFTLLGADASNGGSWNIDSYGPIIARGRVGTNFISFHTDTTGRHLGAFYNTPIKDGTSPSLVFEVLPQGNVHIANQGSGNDSLVIEGPTAANAIRVNPAFGAANPSWKVTPQGRMTVGTTPVWQVDSSTGQTHVGAAAVAVPGFGQLDIANNGNATLQVRNTLGSNADLIAGSTSTTLQTLNNTSLGLTANGHTGMRISGAGGVGLYGATPVLQSPAIPQPTGGTVIDTQARVAINSILAAMSQTAGGIGITA